MKNILTLAHADDGQEARFQAALDLVRAFDGHLVCVDIERTPMPLVDAFSQAGLHMVEDEINAGQTANRASLVERLAVEGVPFDWITTKGNIASELAKHAALADIVVLNRRLAAATPAMDRIVADVLVGTRKPVLAVPEWMRSLPVPAARAMVAWDGSDEAVRALSAAVPLLGRAASVTIVAIGPAPLRDDGEEAARYLSRHGIKPAVRQIEGRDDYVPPLLLDEAKRLQADYLVMGGFGHWRLVEHIIRGNSHWLLGAARVPLFMVH